jgi:hypothetical protein
MTRLKQTKKLVNLFSKKISTNIPAAKENLNSKPFDSIPGPKYYPVIGNLLSLKQHGSLKLLKNNLINHLNPFKGGDID